MSDVTLSLTAFTLRKALVLASLGSRALAGHKEVSDKILAALVHEDGPHAGLDALEKEFDEAYKAESDRAET